MKISFRKLTLGALALGACVAAFGQSPVISSFSQNGELVCTNLLVGSMATVEWASFVTGPWTNNWAGLESVTADSNGIIRVSVPMFYRVRGVAAPAKMALIPAGTFQMGDAFNEGNGDERPTHAVYVSGFYMDKYEVTKALWDEVSQWATNHGYSLGGGGGKAENHPVQGIPWRGMVKWCNARSEKEGRIPAYYTDAAQTDVYRTGGSDVQNDWVKWNAGYRLPTEAEWEKAARGGLSGFRFPWGDTISHSQANYYSTRDYSYDVSPTQGLHPAYADGDEPHTAPAGLFGASGYGLYDMTGNVWEMCWDWYDGGYYSTSPTSDPRGPATGNERVRRGGGWGVGSPAYNCRVSFRASWPPNVFNDRVGFRCVLPLGQ